MQFTLQTPESSKLLKSAVIVALALVALWVLKLAFPAFDWVSVESGILALVSAWIVNLVKESTGN